MPKNKENYRIQEKLSFIGILFGLPNLVLTFISSLYANSMLVWAELIIALKLIMHFMLVFIVSGKLKKDTTEAYNYGVCRVEVFVTFICNLLMSLGIIVVFCVSVFSLLYPKQPDKILLYFVILKLIDIIVEFLLFKKQSAVCLRHPSRMNDTERANWYEMFLESSISFAFLIICYLLREYKISWYLGSLVSLILMAYFMYECIHRMKACYRDLSDMAIPKDEREVILDILNENTQEIKCINSLSSRVLNHYTYIDINVTFFDGITYKEQRELLTEIDRKIKNNYPDSFVHFVIGDGFVRGRSK